MIEWFKKIGIFNLILFGIIGVITIGKTIFDFIISKGKIFNLICLCIVAICILIYIIKQIIIKAGKK